MLAVAKWLFPAIELLLYRRRSKTIARALPMPYNKFPDE